MYYREPRGVMTGEQDACRDCREFEGGTTVCVSLGILLNEALEKGMHLEVLYCPHYNPRLGQEGKS